VSRFEKGRSMSDYPMSANDSVAPGGENKSVQLHKVPIEWGELIGFRRRTSSPAGTQALQNVKSTGDGLVVVGRGASIVGEITNCSQVEIAGSLEGKVVAEVVVIRAGGCLKGQVCSERAEVHGTIEGQVQVEDHLDIRSTGQVSGELTYGKLSVASGGRLEGTIEIVPEPHEPEFSAEHLEDETSDVPEAMASSSAF